MTDFAPSATTPFRRADGTRVPVCSANATGRIASEWGMSAVPCSTTRGLRSMIDAHGIVRRFCGTVGHQAQVERRFGRQSEAQRVSLAIERISRDFTAELEEDVDEEVEFLREGLPEFSGQFR